MLLSNPRQAFLLFLILTSILQACGGSQTKVNNGPQDIEAEKTAFPFSIREPQVYSGEIVQTSGSVTAIFFVARNGEKSRLDFDRGGENNISRIHNEGDFVVSFSKKSYYEMPAGIRDSLAVSPVDTLTRGFLEGYERAKFEKIGSSNGQTKYRVNFVPDGRSETFIYIDDTVAMPVKQEFFAVDGERRTIMLSVEFKDQIGRAHV